MQPRKLRRTVKPYFADWRDASGRRRRRAFASLNEADQFQAAMNARKLALVLGRKIAATGRGVLTKECVRIVQFVAAGRKPPLSASLAPPHPAQRERRVFS